jgi:hypothetical protein
MGWARFNHLVAPTNNPMVRQAIMKACNQEDFLKTAIGNPEYYKVCKSIYPCGTTYETDAGFVNQNVADAKTLLAQSGYKGEELVILQPTDHPVLNPFCQVMAEQLRAIGMNVKLQAMDWSTVLQRRASKDPTDKGGWNMFCTWWIGGDTVNPLTGVGFGATGEKGQGIAPQHHHNGHRFSFGEIFLAMQIAMVPNRHGDADGIAVMHLGAVGACIEPALFRVLRDAVGARADIAPTIIGMPDGRREFENIHILAHHDILEDGPRFHHGVFDAFWILQIGLPIGFAQFPFVEMIRKTKRHVAAAPGEYIHQDTKPLRTPLDIVEYDAGTIFVPQHGFSGQSDFALPGGALHDSHLANTLGLQKPFPEVFVDNMPGHV